MSELAEVIECDLSLTDEYDDGEGSCKGDTAFVLEEDDEDFESFPIITFCQELDNILGGGICCGVITEVFGDKGIGKTTLCYQLALDVQIPNTLGGLESECFFIDTENSFSLSRLRVMAAKCAEHCHDVRSDSNLTEDSLLEGTHYTACGSVSELQDIIFELDEYMTRHVKVKLLIIDSLAFLFYTETEHFNTRGQALYKLVQDLLQLARKFQIAIVITNNMTTRFDEGGNEYKIPYLGDSWSHIASTRLQLLSDGGLRSARTTKSQTSNHDTANFKIISAGIRK